MKLRKQRKRADRFAYSDSEGRSSGVILSCLPVSLALILSQMGSGHNFETKTPLGSAPAELVRMVSRLLALGLTLLVNLKALFM